MAGDASAFPRVAKAAETAHRDWKAGDDRGRKRLSCIYHLEKHLLIQRAVTAQKPLVIYDLDAPKLVAAWGHPDFFYTRQAFRHQGLATELRKAICRPKT